MGEPGPRRGEVLPGWPLAYLHNHAGRQGAAAAPARSGVGRQVETGRVLQAGRAAGVQRRFELASDHEREVAGGTEEREESGSRGRKPAHAAETDWPDHETSPSRRWRNDRVQKRGRLQLQRRQPVCRGRGLRGTRRRETGTRRKSLDRARSGKRYRQHFRQRHQARLERLRVTSGDGGRLADHQQLAAVFRSTEGRPANTRLERSGIRQS